MSDQYHIGHVERPDVNRWGAGASPAQTIKGAVHVRSLVAQIGARCQQVSDQYHSGHVERPAEFGRLSVRVRPK